MVWLVKWWGTDHVQALQPSQLWKCNYVKNPTSLVDRSVWQFKVFQISSCINWVRYDISLILIPHKGIKCYIGKTRLCTMVVDLWTIMYYLIWGRWDVSPQETPLMFHCPVSHKRRLTAMYYIGTVHMITPKKLDCFRSLEWDSQEDVQALTFKMLFSELKKMERNLLLMMACNIMGITFLTQSSNRTTMRIRESQFFIKLTSVLWSAFSMSCPLIDRITSP